MADNDPTSVEAEWKKVQQNTFTRWCNDHLKAEDLYIYNLETDLCNGVKLIRLLQVLARKKIARYNKRPVFSAQKLENISKALQFIQDEDIRLVNIDASDILKGKLKLILGLIWTLILKYTISVNFDDQEGLTPKQQLLAWVNEKIPDFSITNFNKDWTDGNAICALINACAPGLCPEGKESGEKNDLENVQKAMKLAEEWLGVPQLITPEEILNTNVDELSIMTYLSYFVKAKVKAGAPLAN